MTVSRWYLHPYSWTWDHTSHLLGPTADNLRNVVVELRNGAIKFLGDNYTSVAVSLPMQHNIHCISSQVSSQGLVTVDFFTVAGLSRGGSVLYLETQDSQLISRSTREVNTAFPNLQSAFTPVNLFIATWLQVSPPNGTEVSWYKVTTTIITYNYTDEYVPSRHIYWWSTFICHFSVRWHTMVGR